MAQLLSQQDANLVERLRAGDEEAFMELIRSLNPSLLRVARMFVPTAALAEDVVQETWLAVLNGIDRFEGRSSLKTWIFRILTNTAKTRGERERRSVPFSSLDTEQGGFEPAVERARFTGSGHPGGLPRAGPPDRPFAEGSLSPLERAIARLPPRQPTGVTLRDLHRL